MANLINGTLSGVSRAAGAVSGATNRLATRAATTLTARNTLPNQVYLADLFRMKLFSKVDFDSVIEYLRSNHILNCENFYTIKSLSLDLLPKVAYDALKHRSPKKALGLFALTGKLCMRRKKGLLCYIDMASGYAKKIYKFEDFLLFANVPDNTQPANLWIPTEVAFPRLRQRVIASREQAALATNGMPTQDAITMSVPPGNQMPTSASASAPAPAPAPRYLEELPQLRTPSRNDPNQTGIFSRSVIDPVEVFLSEYQVLTEEQNVNVDKPFDSLLFALVHMALEANPSEDINQFIKEVSNLFALTGVNDFTLALQQSRGEIMCSFRRLYGLPDGDGTSNNLFASAIFCLWEKQTGAQVKDEPSQKFLDLRKRLFEIQRMKAEQEAEEAARAAEQEVQDKLTELSQNVRAPSNAEDIIL